MRLRGAVAADAAALAKVHGAAFEAPWSEAVIEDLLAAPGAFALMAEDAAPFAFILARTAADEAEILTFAVDPSRRRRGTGRALIHAAAELAAAAGARSLLLEVAADNGPAIALYMQAGFEALGRRPGYYTRTDGPIDALLLRRPLNSPPPYVYPLD